MRRLAATVARDVKLQHRYGLYAVSVVVVAGFTGLLRLLPSSLRIDPAVWMPPFVAGNLLVTTFFFMGSSVLLERDEGTIDATVTTPVRDLEYLGSKVLTFSLLGLVETGLVTWYVFGLPDAPVAAIGGTLLLGALFGLFGFVSVARHASINGWLMPSMLWILGLLLPLLGHFGLIAREWQIWHPTEPALLLLRASYEPTPPALEALAWSLATAWLIALTILARRTFERYVVRQSGATP